MMNPRRSTKSQSFNSAQVDLNDDQLGDGQQTIVQIKQHSSQSNNETKIDLANTAICQEQSVNKIEPESSSSSTSTDYKNAGNRLCSQFRYEEAIKHYIKAIEKSPDVAIFYSNKALCHLKLQEWALAVQDCRCALELDPSLIKAHYFLGQALAEMENFDESLRHLQRAHELAKEKKLNFGDDITCQIRLVKRRRWCKIEDEQSKLEEELENYLVNLIKKDKETLQNGPTTSDDDGTSRMEDIEKKCDIYTDKITDIFSNIRMQRKRRDVPDYLCGKISFEIMRDPIITPCGVTYDKHDIEEHLCRVGHFDPITRQPLTVNQLIPNLAMKEVVDAYLKENEWAHYY